MGSMGSALRRFEGSENLSPSSVRRTWSAVSSVDASEASKSSTRTAIEIRPQKGAQQPNP